MARRPVQTQPRTLVAALDVGSSKVCALIAEPGVDGKLRILGTGQRESRGVKRGFIADMEKSEIAIRESMEQAERIAALREAAGDGLVINARVDSFRGVDAKDALADGIARAKAYLDAGADCVYPIHLGAPDLIAEFVREVGGAVNSAAWPGGPGLAGLAGLGVARISLGGGLWQYARKQLGATLAGVAEGKLPY